MSRLQSNTRHLRVVAASGDGDPDQITLDQAIVDDVPDQVATLTAVTTASAIVTAAVAHPDRVPALSSLTGDFLEYHRANPGVYSELRRIAREYIATTGAEKIGAQQLIEAFRWHTHMRTRSTDFKINNNHAAFYARALDWFEADLRGKFQMRRSDEADAWIRGYQQQAIHRAQRAA